MDAVTQTITVARPSKFRARAKLEDEKFLAYIFYVLQIWPTQFITLHFMWQVARSKRVNDCGDMNGQILIANWKNSLLKFDRSYLQNIFDFRFSPFNYDFCGLGYCLLITLISCWVCSKGSLKTHAVFTLDGNGNTLEQKSGFSGIFR